MRLPCADSWGRMNRPRSILLSLSLSVSANYQPRNYSVIQTKIPPLKFFDSHCTQVSPVFLKIYKTEVVWCLTWQFYRKLLVLQDETDAIMLHCCYLEEIQAERHWYCWIYTESEESNMLVSLLMWAMRFIHTVFCMDISTITAVSWSCFLSVISNIAQLLRFFSVHMSLLWVAVKCTITV